MSEQDIGPNPTYNEVVQQVRWLTQRVNVLLDLHLPNFSEADIALLKHKVRVLENRVNDLALPRIFPVASSSAAPDSTS